MIGLLGGTFDPIHFGHLRPALDVMEALSLDVLRFIPAPRPPLRGEPVVTPQQRVEMVRLAITPQPGFDLDTRELDREGPSYTVDTLQALREELGEATPLVLLLGSDAFSRLPDWHKWERLPDLAHIAVMMRPDAVLDEGGFPDGWLQARLTDAAGALRERPSGCVITLPVTQLAISATDIRARLATGKSIRYLTPDAVCDYIADHRLYR